MRRAVWLLLALAFAAGLLIAQSVGVPYRTLDGPESPHGGTYIATLTEYLELTQADSDCSYEVDTGVGFDTYRSWRVSVPAGTWRLLTIAVAEANVSVAFAADAWNVEGIPAEGCAFGCRCGWLSAIPLASGGSAIKSWDLRVTGDTLWLEAREQDALHVSLRWEG